MKKDDHIIKTLRMALEAAEVLEKLFKQAEAMYEGGMPEANIDCQITTSDLRKGLYAASELRRAQSELDSSSSGTATHTCGLAEDYLRDKYGAYRGHHAWREIEEAFNAGKRAQSVAKDSEPMLCSFPERDPTKPAEQQGLIRKFIVTRVDGNDAPGRKHHGCEYFVLDIDHDIHAAAALRAYAEACKGSHPQLSAELIDKFGGQPAPKRPEGVV